MFVKDKPYENSKAIHKTDKHRKFCRINNKKTNTGVTLKLYNFLRITFKILFSKYKLQKNIKTLQKTSDYRQNSDKITKTNAGV